MLSNRWLDLFNDDLIGLVPPRISVATFHVSTTATANTKSNFHSPRRNPTTIALYVGRPVDVNVDVMEQGTVNGGRNFAFRAIKSEVPSSAAMRAACDAKVTHVHHAEVSIAPFLYEITFLQQNARYFEYIGMIR